ncbi:outer membrane protein assembly factor BamB family protein [Cryobacterium sp. AP23]
MRTRFSIAVFVAAVVIASTAVAGPVSAADPAPVGHVPYPAGGTQALCAGTNAANQNAQLAETLPAEIKASWKASPPLCPSTDGSAATTVSVAGSVTVVLDRQHQCSFLSAYSTSTGSLIWRNDYHFGYPQRISGSTVYFQHDDPANGTTIVEALALSTGKVIWSTALSSNSTLEVGGGIVSVGRAVLDAATGKLKYLLTSQVANNASTFISDGRLFINNGPYVQAYTIATGQRLWSITKPGGFFGPGWGSARPALNKGLLYITSITGQDTGLTLVLNPATGGVVRTLPRSDNNLAFDGNVGIFTVTDQSSTIASVISAVNLTTGAVYWKRSLPTDQSGPAIVAAAAPLIANGVVWFYSGYNTGTPGHIFGVNEATGAVLSTTIEPCPVSFDATGIIIAQHRLFAPSSCGILTYTAATAAPVPPTVPPAAAQVLPDPGFEAGTGGWRAFTTGTLASVKSPAHGGSHALTVSAASATAGSVGITQNTAVSSSVKGATYTISCWVRPTTPGLNLTVRFLEYPTDWSKSTHLTTTTFKALPASTWTAVRVSSVAVNSGDRIVPQLYSANQTTKTGSITYDDCSLTRGETPHP